MVVDQQLPAPAPLVNPEVKVFWDATAEGRMLLPRCQDCETVIWFPRPFCPACGSLKIDWIEASGRGTVYSYTVNRRGAGDLPEYRDPGPYVLAYVELDEGPRIMTNIVDCDLDSVEIGQAVEVVFHDTGQGTALPRFRPTTRRASEEHGRGQASPEMPRSPDASGERGGRPQPGGQP